MASAITIDTIAWFYIILGCFCRFYALKITFFLKVSQIFRRKV